MLWVIWGALFSSIGLYLVVLQVSDAPEQSSAGGNENLRKTLLIVALVVMALSLVVKYFVSHRVKPEGEKGVPSWAFPAYIIALALGESPAIFGLILGLQGEELNSYLPLFVMALVTMGLIAPPFFFPKKES